MKRFPNAMRAVVMPVELVVGTFAAITFTLLWYFGVEFRYSPQLGYLRQILLSLDTGVHIYIAIFSIEIFCAYKLTGRSTSFKNVWIQYSESYLSPRALFVTLRLINAWILTFLLFMQLKHLIPYVNGRLYDTPMLELEQVVFDGKMVGEWLVLALGKTWFGYDVVGLVSKSYILWYPYFTILFFVLVVSKDRVRAQEFCCAFALSFLLGVLTVYLFPTLGPCFAAPERYAFLSGTEIAGVQHDLWQMKLALDEDRNDRGAVYLISGLPSLHFTVTLIGTYYLRTLHWTLFATSAAFAAVTFVSTLYLGGHYLLDDVVAIPLAACAVYGSRFVAWGVWRRGPRGMSGES